MITTEIDAEMLRRFVDRIERVQGELDGLNEDKGEIYKEAKSTGFDTKIIKSIIQRRKNGEGATEQADSLLTIYERALKTAEAASSPSSRTRTRERDGLEYAVTEH